MPFNVGEVKNLWQTVRYKGSNNYNLLTFGDPKVITKLTGGERLKVTDRVGP